MTKDVWERIEKTLEGYLGIAIDPDVEATIKSLVDDTARHNLDVVLANHHISYRDGVIIQLAYAVESPGLDTTIRHPGARSIAGRLGKFLANNHVSAVADAYQNIGKNSTNLVRGNFPEFDAFLQWAAQAGHDQLDACFQYACSRVAATARPVSPMPEIDVTKLSFASVLSLFEELLATPSEGAHEQFIVGSVLDALVEQSRIQYRVETKKLNASDRSSRAAGDIQVLTGNRVIEAYEVTGNDWRTKIDGIGEKLKAHDLSRVHIIARMDSRDYASVAHDLLAVPEDVSVIDIHGFVASVVSTLTKTYRSHALYRLYEYLDRYQESVERVNAYVKVLKARNLTHGTG